MTFDDPLITYDGAPTDVFFAQLLAKVEATPASTVAALQAVGGGGPSTNDIAAAVLALAQITPIYADMRKTNGQNIIGDGTEGNKFRSHLVG